MPDQQREQFIRPWKTKIILLPCEPTLSLSLRRARGENRHGPAGQHAGACVWPKCTENGAQGRNASIRAKSPTKSIGDYAPRRAACTTALCSWATPASQRVTFELRKQNYRRHLCL